ncbi:MAG: DMT family transporter [Pseudomonadota bacterium]
MTRTTALAISAALFSVAIWANFLVTTGGVVGAGLGTVELGVLRAVCCTIALLPVIWRIGLYPRGLEFWRFLIMTLGAGLSFMFLIPLGFHFAPPADSGIFAPGVLPLWVAILSWLVLKERISPSRILGFVLIAIGVFTVGGYSALSQAEGQEWLGYMCFSGGSLLFSFYTIAQRGSGLTALEATALISVWCIPIAIVVIAIFGVDFSTVSVPALAWTALAQFGSGVVAIVTYTYAIMQLGPSRGSAFIALTPVIVALASGLFLGKPATDLALVGAAVVSVGVLIASGLFERHRRPVSGEIPP